MKKNIQLFVILIYSIQSVAAQSVEHLYDVIPGFSQASSKILPNTRGGYVIAGNVETSYTPGVNNKIFMTGINNNGELEWTKSYLSNVQLHQFSRAITQLSSSSQAGGSGYFMVCGGKTGNTPKVFAVRTNPLGNALATSTSTLPYEVTFNNVCNASNGGFIAVGVTGESNPFSLVCGDAVIARFNVQGSLVWIKKLLLPVPFTCTYGPGSVIQAPGGGYIIAGDLLVWKTDANGNQQWVKSLSSIGYLSRYDDIQQLPSGEGYLMTGWKTGNSYGVYAAKLDNNGNLLASNTLATDAADILAHTPVFLSSSEALLTATFTSDLLIRGYKFNLNDLQVTESGYVGNGIPAWTCTLLRKNGNYIIGGEGLDPNNNYNGNFYSFITDDLTLNSFAPTADRSALPEQLLSFRRIQPEVLQGAIDVRKQLIGTTPQENNGLSAFPNPATSFVNLSGPALQTATWLKVLNMEGVLMLERKVTNGEAAISLDLTALPKGVYVVQVSSETSMETLKITLK